LSFGIGTVPCGGRLVFEREIPLHAKHKLAFSSGRLALLLGTRSFPFCRNCGRIHADAGVAGGGPQPFPVLRENDAHRTHRTLIKLKERGPAVFDLHQQMLLGAW
jgi:hypothetical protein